MKVPEWFPLVYARPSFEPDASAPDLAARLIRLIELHGQDSTVKFYADKLVFCWERPETPEEEQKRLEREARVKKREQDDRDRGDRAEYERLKKKFEGK